MKSVSEPGHKKRPENSSGAAWLRGGQTVSHTWDMILELLRKVGILYVVWLIICWAIADHAAPDKDQLYAVMHFVAGFYRFLNLSNLHVVQVPDDYGVLQNIEAKSYDTVPFIAAHEAIYFHYMWMGFWLFLLGGIGVACGLSYWFVKHGDEKLQSSEIRGQQIVPLRDLMGQIKSYNATKVAEINVATLIKLGLPSANANPDRIDKIYTAARKFVTDTIDMFKKHDTELKIDHLEADGAKYDDAWKRIKADPNLAHKIIAGERWTSGELYGYEKEPLWIIRREAAKLGLPFYISPDDYIAPKLAEVPYPIGAEYEHTLVVGGTGSGKSVALHSLVDTIKERKNCAIIYDPEGEYIRLHYREGIDKIFNPFDIRTVGWSPYNDLYEKTDWDSAAEDLFPDPKSGDPYWTLATRNIYATAGALLGSKFQTLHKRKPTIREFLDLLIADQETLYEALHKTSAANTLGEKSGPRADSLRSVLNTGIDRLSNLIGTKEDFSFKQWVNDPNERGILFLSSPEHLAASIKPILAHVSSLTVTALLSRDVEQSKKTTWVILDEFASLGKMDTLAQSPTRLRKFGGCMVIGMQQVSQIESIYGPEDAQTIVGQLRNKLILACADPKTGESMSKLLGQREVRRIEETTSYGANNIRDGVGLAPKDTIEPIAMPEQIQRLPTRTGYLMFSPGGQGKPFPVSLVTYNYKNRNSHVEKFIPHGRPNPIQQAYIKSLMGEDEVDEGKMSPNEDQEKATLGSDANHEALKEMTKVDTPELAPTETEASLSGPREDVKQDGSVTSLTRDDIREATTTDPEARLKGIGDVFNALGGGKPLPAPEQDMSL